MFEIIEYFDPEPEAMVRSFHCTVCNKRHLTTGRLAWVWVNFNGGYQSQAHEDCVKDLEYKA